MENLDRKSQIPHSLLIRTLTQNRTLGVWDFGFEPPRQWLTMRRKAHANPPESPPKATLECAPGIVYQEEATERAPLFQTARAESSVSTPAKLAQKTCGQPFGRIGLKETKVARPRSSRGMYESQPQHLKPYSPEQR